MNALYAYFGLRGTSNTLDIPGHGFYQIPLMESIYVKYDISTFDFYSYIPSDVIQGQNLEYNVGHLGDLLRQTDRALIDVTPYCYSDVIKNIMEKKYDLIFLKARFRNLSTLTKKWNDATQFENIIETAIAVGYDPSSIVILDTDLSLPQNFLEYAHNLKIDIKIPSIHFQPISVRMLDLFYSVTKLDIAEKFKANDFIFYGNIPDPNNTSYKAGHTKNPILHECIDVAINLNHYNSQYHVILAGKIPPNYNPRTYFIPRTERSEIYDRFSMSKICLNVSKDLYTERKFIPARVYEAIMFGAIPVSYNMPYIHPALSFSNIEEYREILKYILELNSADYLSLYRQVIDSIIAMG